MAGPVPFAEWYADLERPPRLRLGQTAFNSLVEARPELAEAIRGGPLDPYPDDRRMPEFLGFLAGCWHEPTRSADPEAWAAECIRRYRLDEEAENG